MGKIDARLQELGLSLPTPPKPVAAYVPAVLHNGLLYISGQLPMVDGQLSCTGHVGQDVGLEAAQAAARVCTLNALSIARDVLGDLDRIVRVVKVGGFVSSTPDFTDHPKVINGCSELLGKIFGDAGRHARAAVGVSALPLNAAVEIEFVMAVAEA
ncbi:MAG: RidA family protein [Candidatus Sericytochromatia bacterium]